MQNILENSRETRLSLVTDTWVGVRNAFQNKIWCCLTFLNYCNFSLNFPLISWSFHDPICTFSLTFLNFCNFSLNSWSFLDPFRIFSLTFLNFCNFFLNFSLLSWSFLDPIYIFSLTFLNFRHFSSTFLSFLGHSLILSAVIPQLWRKSHCVRPTHS